MPTVDLAVSVDTVTCSHAGCTTGPVNMVPTTTYRKADGSIACGSQRLPDAWIRMSQVNADGSESAFKVYCPACAASL